MKNLMNTLRLPDDMPVEHGLISKSIESAQKKVEGHNFDIRKHLVEYDDVINKHREVIYNKRDGILYTYERLKKDGVVSEGKITNNQETIIKEYPITNNQNVETSHGEDMDKDAKEHKSET